MTPAEHLDAAEGLLAQVVDYDTEPGRAVAQFLTLWALTHAVMALAVELGVPHAPAAAPGVPSA